MIYFMLTNIISESTEVLYVGDGARELLLEAFNVSEEDKRIILQKVVSRKKQFIPPIFESIGSR